MRHYGHLEALAVGSDPWSVDRSRRARLAYRAGTDSRAARTTRGEAGSKSYGSLFLACRRRV